MCHKNEIPTENELCKIFNVSSSAVREAIQKMSAKGIVEVKRKWYLCVLNQYQKCFWDAQFILWAFI